MTIQHVELGSITVTNGSQTVNVTSGEDISRYISGDLLFIEGRNPLVITSANGTNLGLPENADFNYTGSALLLASNVSLRDALRVIEENNAKWSLHFSPFINWISTSDPQATMYDTLGNAITVYSAQGLNQLAQNIAQADTGLAGIEQRITDAENDLSGLETPIQEAKDARDEAVTAAQAAAADADAAAADRQATGQDASATDADRQATAADASAALTARNEAEQFRDQAQAIVLADGDNPVFTTLRTTGGMETDGYVVAGVGSGGVALTHNDGYGNASVTFNHKSGVPEQDGSSGRITVNTDTTVAGAAAMDFFLGGATAGVASGLALALRLQENAVITFGDFVTKDKGSGAELLKVYEESVRYRGVRLVSYDYHYNNTEKDFTGSKRPVLRYMCLLGNKTVILGSAAFEGQRAVLGRAFDDPDGVMTIQCATNVIHTPDGSSSGTHTLTGRGIVEMVGDSAGAWVIERVTG